MRERIYRHTPSKTVIIFLLFFCAAFIFSQPAAAQTMSSIDIIIEGDTYIPYFYPGRAEPSSGNPLRLIAVSNSAISPASYTWRVGNRHFSTNEPVLRVTVPIVEQRVLVEVTALNEAGQSLGRASEYISMSAPRLLFYEDNALRGTSRVASQEGFIMAGNEISVKAEPYFAGTNAPVSLRASWSSSLPIEPSREDWRLLYIRRPETAITKGQIRLQVANPENLNEYLSATFDLKL